MSKRRASWASIGLGLVLATPQPAFAAGKVAEVTESAREPSERHEFALDVEVDAGIDGASELKRWIGEVSRNSLDRRAPGAAPLRGTVHIEVTGALYDYQVTLSTTRLGKVISEPDVWACECSNEELLEKVGEKVLVVASRLEVEEEQPKTSKGPPTPRPPEPDSTEEPPGGDDGSRPGRRRLNPAGKAGVALMSLGVLGVGAGVPLIVLHDRPLPPENSVWSRYQARHYRTPGIVTAGVGAGLLLTGVIVYALRDRLGRERSNVVVLTPATDVQSSVTLHLSGRF